MTTRDELYLKLLESPLGVQGVEQTLPALENLLREARTEKFWDGKRPRRLDPETMIQAWADFRQDLIELKARLRQTQDGDSLLSWLVLFVINHYRELARTSARYEPSFRLAFDMSWATMTAEEALAVRDDWQRWVVDWLRDALRDEDLNTSPSVTCEGRGGDSGEDGDSVLSLQPKPKVAPDNALGIDF